VRGISYLVEGAVGASCVVPAKEVGPAQDSGNRFREENEGRV
jgi:hypothetical protein